MRTWITPIRHLAAALALGTLLAPPVAAQESADAETPAIAQDYAPDPAIWLVEDEDTRLYLFGTVHVLPQGFRWRSALLDEIIDDADELIVESSGADVSDGPVMERMMAAIGKRKPVSQRLSPRNRAKWFALAELAGMDAEQFDRMPPLMALLGMGTAIGMDLTRASAEYGVETVLETAFSKAGKPIGSIEKAGDVLASLLAIDEVTLIKELDRELSRWNGKGMEAAMAQQPHKAGSAALDDLLSTEHAWAQGQEIDLNAEFAGEMGVSILLGKRLLDDRNQAWARWIERRLAEPGTVLIAVGAGHLGGRGSVQEMLAQRGLHAERIN